MSKGGLQNHEKSNDINGCPVATSHRMVAGITITGESWLHQHPVSAHKTVCGSVSGYGHLKTVCPNIMLMQ